MPGEVNLPCRAVILRVAPDPSSGELLNVGVVLHSPGHRFLGVRFPNTWKRVTDAFPDADRVHLRRIANAIERASSEAYRTQLALDAPLEDIVRLVRTWIPEDDSGLVVSQPLSGITADPERTLRELFERYVVGGEASERRVSRADADVWRDITPALAARGVLDRLRTHVLRGRHRYEETFDHAWRNGQWNVARPVSLDLLEPNDILRKAAEWGGRVRALEPASQDTTVVLVIGLPGPAASATTRRAGEDGLGLLRELLADEGLAEVTTEHDAPKLADRIADDLTHRAAE